VSDSRPLIRPPSLTEVAISKGTANVSAADLKKLAPLMKHYGKMAHPFTVCVRDNTKRWGPELAKKRCAVLKDLIRGTTKWRNREEEDAAREAYDEAVRRVGQLAEILGAEFVVGVALQEEALTAKKRKKLPKKSFAIPETESYPIHDESHARNALARVSQHGTPEEKKRVRAAVKRRYKKIGVKEIELLEEVAAEISDCETLIRYLGPTLVEARIWVPSYKRLGSNVSGYWRELAAHISSNDGVDLPGGVRVRKLGGAGGYRVTAPSKPDSHVIQRPEDAAKAALNRSAETDAPDSPGGASTRSRSFAKALGGDPRTVAAKAAGDRHMDAGHGEGRMHMNPTGTPDATQHHDYVDYSVVGKTRGEEPKALQDDRARLKAMDEEILKLRAAGEEQGARGKTLTAERKKLVASIQQQREDFKKKSPLRPKTPASGRSNLTRGEREARRPGQVPGAATSNPNVKIAGSYYAVEDLGGGKYRVTHPEGNGKRSTNYTAKSQRDAAQQAHGDKVARQKKATGATPQGGSAKAQNAANKAAAARKAKKRTVRVEPMDTGPELKGKLKDLADPKTDSKRLNADGIIVTFRGGVYRFKDTTTGGTNSASGLTAAASLLRRHRPGGGGSMGWSFPTGSR
jgi:uncharacterized protein YbjQ (UPF0145 family)